jgi:ubiquinone/menaquinone biosynthesis C-methylase UbiE
MDVQEFQRRQWRDKWADRRGDVNAFAKKVFRMLPKKRPVTLLDLGCGNGVDSLFFASHGVSVTALDFSESGIDALRADIKKSGLKQIKPVLHDLSKRLPFKSSAFDVIYAHLSVHYFDDAATRAIFAEMLRVLKPGGSLFVKCKSVDDALYGVGDKIGPDMYRKGHIRHFFSRDYMKGLLSDWKIVSVRRTSSTYHLYKSSFIEAVAKKPARD